MGKDLPMLAIPSTGASGHPRYTLEKLVERGWMLDLKLDGVRSFRRYGRLINRLGVDITNRYPEIPPFADYWLDGEIVALDGRFETALLRDSQSRPSAIKKLAEQHPCKFVAFDALGDDFACHRMYSIRRGYLERLSEQEGIEITPASPNLSFFDEVGALGMEGVIAKRPGAGYQFGRRSRDWVKFKHLHRVTAVLLAYTEGTGAREHFGALELAMVTPDGDPVSVGRVGSGFTEKETWALKTRMDAGELLVGEIECVNLTSNGTLRFPVWKGIRTDVAPIDCSTTQLDSLPRS